MNKTNRFICILAFLFCHLFYAQVKKEKESLRDFLIKIEQQFNCHFSYADKTIEGIFLEKEQIFSSINDVLFFFEKEDGITIHTFKG